MVPKILLIISIVILAMVGWRFASTGYGCPDFHQGSVVVNNDNRETIAVAIVNQAKQQAKGLSGCPTMGDTQGMLFLFNNPKPVIFWMKDMLIPLDIVWLHNHVVVGLVSRVMPPATSREKLPQYQSPQAVDAVLEINSGQAAALGIVTGSTISY